MSRFLCQDSFQTIPWSKAADLLTHCSKRLASLILSIYRHWRCSISSLIYTEHSVHHSHRKFQRFSIVTNSRRQNVRPYRDHRIHHKGPPYFSRRQSFRIRVEPFLRRASTLAERSHRAQTSILHVGLSLVGLGFSLVLLLFCKLIELSFADARKCRDSRFQRALEKAETGKVIQALEQAKAREILPPDNLVKSDNLPPASTTLQFLEQYNKLPVDFKTNEVQPIRLNLRITIEKDGSPILHSFRSNEAIESIAVSKSPSDLVYYPKKGDLFEDPLRIICNIRLSRGPKITLLVAVNKNVLNGSRECVVVDQFVKGQRHVPVERKGELLQYRGETNERHVHFRT